MMIAIGGTIGTGIFLSAGSPIALAGPGNALLSYFVVGIFVYGVVISLGEMSAMYPVSGAFFVFGTRFVSPAFGFTYSWYRSLTTHPPLDLSLLLRTAASELTAAAVVLQYWAPYLQTWQWALIVIVPVFSLQLIYVKVYGLYIFATPIIHTWPLTFTCLLWENPNTGLP